MRYLETVAVPIDSLTLYPGNPRRRDRIDDLRESIRVNGQYRSLTVRVEPDARTILVGNHTWLALVEEGATEARVDLIECNDDEARRIVLVDNKTGERGGYDVDDLLAMLNDVETAGGLMGTGIDSAEYEAMLSEHAAGEARAAGYGATENPYDYDGRPTPDRPEQFPEFGHDIETAYRCPSCSYEWSGNPK
jgi:ParB-like chromosome segregation protein Spo0J